METHIYASLFNYSINYETNKHILKCMYDLNGKIANCKIEGIYHKNKKIACIEDYKKCELNKCYEADSVLITAFYKEGPKEQPNLTLKFILTHNNIKIYVLRREDIEVKFAGSLFWGKNMKTDTFAVCFDREGTDLRSAIGPATSTVDNSLLDRVSGNALCLTGGENIRLNFDWNELVYAFKVSTGNHACILGFEIHVEENVYQKRYGVEYNPINKKCNISTPPSGWMTWYALKFDVNEKKVLENAAFQAKVLKDFGANTIWVDWEWYHKDLSGIRDDGADTFNPDKEKYPKGLAYIASKIKELGLTPAIWVGFTNDPAQNEYIKNNPDIVLANEASWCGQYFLDISHPKFLNDYIQKTFKQVLDWGYEALKWDCIPITLKIHDKYHQNMYDKNISVKNAYRNAVKKARKIIGKDFYMLSCSAERNVDVLYGADLFDAARIGGDIFQWDEFIEQCVKKILTFYPFHNIMFYNDPDNLILREKFNTYAQALSRACFISLLGLPITFGDALTELPEEKIEILKRILPAIDAHPMDIREIAHNLRILKTNLTIETHFEQWNVVNVMNLTRETSQVNLDFKYDLHLESGTYLAYDYWEKQYIGEVSKKLMFKLKPYSCKVICIRKKLNRPQLLSASRHITQGAVDIKNMIWDEKNLTLTAVSSVLENDPYEVLFYVPENYLPLEASYDSNKLKLYQKYSNVYGFTVQNKKTEDVSWSISFSCSLIRKTNT